MARTLELSGMILLGFLALLETIVAIAFFFGTPPLTPMVPFAFALTVLIVSLYCKRFPSKNIVANMAIGTALAIAVIALCVIVAGKTVDMSWDGNAYHKQAVVALAEGWNPTQSSSLNWRLVNSDNALWIDHYPQGLYYAQAAFYSLTHDLEQAKCTTLIMCFVVFFLLSGTLIKYGISTWASLTIACIAALNPIALAQFDTFYLDGFMTLSLFSLLIGLSRWVYSIPAPKGDLSLAIIGCAFILASSCKFTGLAYSGVFSLSFIAVYLLRSSRLKEINLRRLIIPAALFFASLAVSIFVVGWASYCTNFLFNGNPLYPLFGNNRVDIITHQQPKSFEYASRFEKLFLSYFSETANIVYDTDATPTLKIPLTISPNELASLVEPDLRQAGFGPLYSVIVLLNIPLALVVLLQSFKNDRSFFCVFAAYLIPTVLLTFGLSESWWARYACYSYALNAFILAFFASSITRPKASASIAITALVSILLIAIISNAALWTMYGVAGKYKTSTLVRDEIAYIERQVNSDGKTLYVSSGEVSGLLFTLDDKGVAYEYVTPSPDLRDPDGHLRDVAYWFDSPFG